MTAGTRAAVGGRTAKKRALGVGSAGAEQFVEEVLRPYVGKPSWPNVQTLVRILVNQLGVRGFGDLTDELVRRLVRLRSGRAVGTLHKELRQLRPVCVRAVRCGWLDRVPVFPVTGPDVAAFERRWQDGLTPEDVGRILGQYGRVPVSWKARRERVAVALLTLGRLRHVEAWDLRRGDVDLAARVFRMRRREGSSDPRLSSGPTIQIGDQLATILGDWLPDMRGDYVVSGVGGAVPWRINKRGKRPIQCIRRTARAAGVDKEVTFHSLRLFGVKYAGVTVPILFPAGGGKLKRACAVKLGAQRESVFVWTHDMGMLTPKRYFLVKLLRDAGPGGLPPAVIAAAAKRAGINGWWQILEAMRKNSPVWWRAIERPEQAYRGGRWKLSWSPTEPELVPTLTES